FRKSSLFSLKSGMEELALELSRRLDEHMIYSSEVKTLFCSPGSAKVLLENGTSFEADHIFSAIPSTSLAALFGESHKELHQLLLGIPLASVVVVNFGFHRKVLKKKGFGYLIPSFEQEEILGVVWDSSVFPQQNLLPEETRLTVMIGGVRMK